MGRKKHHLSVMYRHLQDCRNLNDRRLDVDLMSKLKIRFKYR